MASISFNLSSSVLEWARKSMGYSIEQTAKKMGVPNEKYESWEKGEKNPTYKQLEDLAEKVYKRPLAILLLKNPPKEDPIQKDFRNLSNAEISNLSPDLRIALRKAKRYQLILEEVAAQDEAPKFKQFKISKTDDPLSASKKFRELLSLSLEEQKSWKPDTSFANFRRYVESIGIYIFMMKLPIEEARAFCITGNFPIIVINKDDSKNATIFSIFHEVCHILFNQNDVFKDIKNGLLNKEYKEIEIFCNLFAASFLVPEDSFNSEIQYLNLVQNNISDSQIQRLATTYNVSNEVIARKLLARQLISEDFFWGKKRFWDSMAKAAKAKENEKLKDNDRGINQGIKIIHDKGRPYVASVVNAYEHGLISSSDLSNYLETKFNHLPKILERLNH
jgi:Zn-dependent peptidase ImmA (M78 family)/DNA-binding XRE family transcriptional regulator